MSENIQSKLGGGKVLHSQSREIVHNVYKFMKDEAERKTLSIPLAKVRPRTAAATGVSERVISKINGELTNLSKEGSDLKCFSTPNKHRNRSRPITSIDDFDKCVIRRLVYDFHVREHRLPTVKLLQVALKERISFIGCESSLRSILKELVFKWKKQKITKKI